MTGSIYHVSGYKVDIGREGLIFEYVYTKFESKFLTDQDHGHDNIWNPELW